MAEPFFAESMAITSQSRAASHAVSVPRPHPASSTLLPRGITGSSSRCVFVVTKMSRRGRFQHSADVRSQFTVQQAFLFV